jgi:hypothetical protein
VACTVPFPFWTPLSVQSGWLFELQPVVGV